MDPNSDTRRVRSVLAAAGCDSNGETKLRLPVVQVSLCADRGKNSIKTHRTGTEVAEKASCAGCRCRSRK